MAGSRPPRALPKTSLRRSAHTNAPHDGCTPWRATTTNADDTQAHGQPHKTERNHAQLGGDTALLQLRTDTKPHARPERPYPPHSIMPPSNCHSPAHPRGKATRGRARQPHEHDEEELEPSLLPREVHLGSQRPDSQWPRRPRWRQHRSPAPRVGASCE